MKSPAVLLLSVSLMQAANYSAGKIRVEDYEVVRLADARNEIEVRVIPSFGNNAYRMTVKGHDIFWPPAPSLKAWHEKPGQVGNPLLAPWANRIAGDSYFANGKEYVLNPKLDNFRRDGSGNPIHGLLVFAPWDVTAMRADDNEAVLVSRLEFWRDPDWMAQFPFAHNLEMIHRLRDGVLEVETIIENLGTEPLPVSLGYHTYYQLTDSPRDEWSVHVAAREQVVLSKELIPTGERRPVPYSDPVKLGGVSFDDVFTSLNRGVDGRAVFSVQGKKQKVEVIFGPNYPVGVVWSPQGRPFICFEPMAGVTNGFNLGHAGKFPVQSVAPGGQWRESFWIRPSGF